VERYFDEPMLNKIAYVNGINDIEFTFYDSTSGVDLGKIICRNIFIYNYHTNFEAGEETFPCLVFDVYREELKGEAIVSTFKKLNYGFSSGYLPSDVPAVPKSDTYYHFKIVNGPVDISIICQKVEQIVISV
jgi:hypothetical protein